MKEISREDAKLVSGGGRWHLRPLPRSAPPTPPTQPHCPFRHQTAMTTAIVQGAIGSVASMIGQSIFSHPSNITCTILGNAAETVTSTISAPGFNPISSIILGGITGGAVTEICSQLTN